MTISRRGPAVLAAIVLLAGIVVGVWWLPRPQLSDEQKIKQLLVQAEQAVEAKDLGGLLGLIASDYDDGIYDRRELRRQALAGFREFRTIRVTPVLRDLQITADTARATLEVDVWLDTSPAEPPLHLSLWVELEKQENRWLVTSAGGDWPD